MPDRRDPESAQAGDPAIEGAYGKQAAGVLRLLESGHFKGVADVRLRINFYEELAARAEVAAQAALPGRATDLVQAVDDQLSDRVTPFLTSEEFREGIREALDTFSKSVQAAVEGSTSSGHLDREAMVDSIRAAFNSLLADTRILLSPRTQESTAGITDDPAPALPPEEPDGTMPEAVDGSRQAADVISPGLDDALTTLADHFELALADLLEFVDAALQPPVPSFPTGNGVAYEKFLVMYDELKNGTSDIDALA